MRSQYPPLWNAPFIPQTLTPRSCGSERDVSEKIALGLTAGAPKLAGDQQFDARLFNQSEGMSAGFGAEDDYNVYSKVQIALKFLSKLVPTPALSPCPNLLRTPC